MRTRVLERSFTLSHGPASGVLARALGVHPIRVLALGALLAAAGLAIGGCGVRAPEEPRAREPVPVKVRLVRPRGFTQYGEYYGELRGIREAELVCPLGGTVERIEVQPGDRIEAGQSLARIDAETAIGRLETARLQERITREAFEREKRFLEIGNASPVSVDRAHLEWLRSRTSLLEARKARDGALAVSPIDGIVAARHIDLYEELAPGASTFTVADMSRMRVTLGVPGTDITSVRAGEKAIVRVASMPGREWEGRTLSYARKRSDRTLTFDVEVVVENPEGLLLSGVTASVRLALRSLEDGIVVPIDAVITREDEKYVMVVNSTTARRVRVETGPSGERDVVIVSGLEAGDRLVVEGINRIADGTPVRIVD